MELAVDTADVVQAVHSLYHSQDPARQAAAGQWLVGLQHTAGAWQVAHEILTSGGSDGTGSGSSSLEAQLFAAQLLRRKIQYAYAEIPASSRLSVRDAIVQYALRFQEAPIQLITQLCLALSALALRLAEWPDPLAHIFIVFGGLAHARGPALPGEPTRFTGAVTFTQPGSFPGQGTLTGPVPSGGTAHFGRVVHTEGDALLSGPVCSGNAAPCGRVSSSGTTSGPGEQSQGAAGRQAQEIGVTGFPRVLLELLHVMPEECLEERGPNLALGTLRRQEFRTQLLCHTSAVLTWLLHQFQLLPLAVPHTADRRRVLQALLSWARVGCFLEIRQEALPTHPATTLVLESLQVPVLFPVAVDVLVELIGRHETMSATVLAQITSLRDAMLLPALAARDEDRVGGLCRIMAEIGATAPTLLTSASPDALSIVDAVIRCIRMPSSEWEVAENGLPFWSKLADALAALPPLVASEARAKFVPPYLDLLDAIIERAKASLPEGDDLMGSDGLLEEGLKFFRLNVEETLASACQLLGPQLYLQKVLSGIASWSSASAPISWNDLEARLHLCHVVADQVLEARGRRDVLAPLMHFIATLPAMPSLPKAAEPLLYYTAAQVVASYADWFGTSPEAALPVLTVLSRSLCLPGAAGPSASAFRRLCEDVPSLASHPVAVEGLVSIGEHLHATVLDIREEENVMCAIGRVLSARPAADTFLHVALQRLLQPIEEELRAVLDAATSQSGCLTLSSAHPLATAAVRALNRLGAILRYVRPEDASEGAPENDVTMAVLGRFWPLLEGLLTSPQLASLTVIAAATCGCLSQAVQAAGPGFVPLLHPFLRVMINGFLSPHADTCYPRAATVAIHEFGSALGHGPILLEAVHAFSKSAFAVQLTSVAACNHHPDLAEAYFTLMVAYVRTGAPDAGAAVEPVLEHIVAQAAVCTSANHRAPAVAALSVLSAILELATSSLNASDQHTTQPSPAAAAAASAASGVIARAGPSITIGLFQALVAPSPLTRVHKVARVLQHLAVFCCLTSNSTMERGRAVLLSWIADGLRSLPPGYLKDGEGIFILKEWGDALLSAVAEVREGSMSGRRRVRGGDWLVGDGARSLKRVVREFLDYHRFLPAV